MSSTRPSLASRYSAPSTGAAPGAPAMCPRMTRSAASACSASAPWKIPSRRSECTSPLDASRRATGSRDSSASSSLRDAARTVAQGDRGGGADRPRHVAPVLGQRRDPVLAVAAQELVGALTGQRDGDLGHGQLAEREEADGREIGERLVQMPGEPGQVVRVGRQRNLELVVLGAVELGDPAGVGQLGVLAGEADRERLDRLVHPARHQRDDQARVEPAAEHRAERHVAHQPHVDRLVELVEHDLGPLVGRALHRVRRGCRVAPVALAPQLAVLDHQALARIELAHVAQRRHRPGHVAHRQVGGDRLVVELVAHETRARSRT